MTVTGRFSAEAELEREQRRREAAVVEAALEFAATREAYIQGSLMATEELYQAHVAARNKLLEAVASLKEMCE